MSAPLKRKAPSAVQTKKTTTTTKPTTKGKKQAPKPAEKDRFDTESSDDGASDEELGVSVIQAVAVPKYAQYSKDITKTKLLSSSSSDSGEDDDSNTLKIDEKYAERYNQRQANKVMSGQVQKFIDKVTKRAAEQEKSQARAEKRVQKKQRKLQRQKMAEELGIEEDSSADDEEAAMLGNGSDTETEDEGYYDKDNELNFLSLLHGLKTRDPKIYDKNQVFFDDAGANENDDRDETIVKNKEKKMTYKQMMTDAAKSGDIDQQDDDIAARYHHGPLSGAVLTKGELEAKQEKLRKDFLEAVALEEAKISKISPKSAQMTNSDDDSESDFDFTPKTSTKKTMKDTDGDSDDESEDDFFGKATIISDPNAISSDSSEDEGPQQPEEQELSVRNQANLYSSNKFIHDDLHEAKKVVQQLQKNIGVGKNVMNTSISSETKRSKMSEADRKALEEADKERFLARYILGGWWQTQDDRGSNSNDGQYDMKEATYSIPLPAAKDLFSEHKSMLLQSNISKNNHDDEDEVIMLANDMYEQQLNFRFDDEGNQIKEVGIATFPRAHLVADSLRQDMSKAKAQRLRQKEQQRLELVRQKELVKRLQSEQRKLAQSKIDAIMKVSGLKRAIDDSDDETRGGDEDGVEVARWSPADLLREFDPAEHDRKSRALYGSKSSSSDKHDQAFGQVAKDGDFEVQPSSSDDDDDDDDDDSDIDSSSDDDTGLSAAKLNQKDKAKILAQLEAHKAQKHKEIDSRLEKVQEKTTSMRQNLPSLLKEQVKKQLEIQKEKQKKAKNQRVTNFSSSDDSDSSDSDSSDDDSISSEIYESQLPADLKHLDRFQMEEEMLSANLKAQTDKQHKSMISDLNEAYIDPVREAESWWSQQRQRIIDKPETQARMAKATTKKEKAEILAEVIREELLAVDDDESACVDLEEEERKMAELSRRGRDTYEHVPSKKVASNPLLGGFRFQYISVPKADFGLSVDDILNSTDQELNKKVSIKKYFPYRDDNADSRHFSEIQAEQSQRYKDYVASQVNKTKILTQEEFSAKQEEKALSGNFKDGGDHRSRPSRNTKDFGNRHKANWSTSDADRARAFVAKNPQALMQARKDKWMKGGNKNNDNSAGGSAQDWKNKRTQGLGGFNNNNNNNNKDGKNFGNRDGKTFDNKTPYAGKTNGRPSGSDGGYKKPSSGFNKGPRQ